MYVLTERADSDFFIVSTNGLTVMLLTLPSDRSPIDGRIHLFKAASILEVPTTQLQHHVQPLRDQPASLPRNASARFKRGGRI
jgi:hypothetical protein